MKSLLKNHGIEVWNAVGCEEVARLLDQTHPELIFTTAGFPDGVWSEVVRLAEESSIPTNVIVVGKSKDMHLYLSAMEFGAFDFILPPFEAAPVAHVARVAAENVRRRRGEQARRAAA